MKRLTSLIMAVSISCSLMLQISFTVFGDDETGETSNKIATAAPTEVKVFSSVSYENDFKSAYQKMKEKYSDVSLTASDADIVCFWDMITKKALGLDSTVEVDFYALNYAEMSSQVLGKVLVTMVNNNFDVTTKVYNESSSVIDLLDSYLSDGEFTKSGASGVTMTTEQVWVMFGYILSNSYLSEDAWDYLLSQQNSDGGFGYGTWSDVATSLWVKTLIEMAGKSAEFADCLQKIDDYVDVNMDYIKDSYDTNSLASVVSYKVFNSESCDDLLEFILGNCYDPEGYFTWGTYGGENAFATQAGAQMIGEYFNGSVYLNLMDDYSPESSEESGEEDSKVIYVTNNTTNSTDNSTKETNNRSTKNQTINNYYQQAEPVVVTNTVTKVIVKDIEIPANEITVNSNPVSNVQPTITLNMPDYRTEIRVCLGVFALIGISYSFSTFFKIFGGSKDEK